MNILHPSDFSKASLKALELAQYLQKVTGGSLTILHAAQPHYASTAHFTNAETEALFEEAERAWAKLIGEQLSSLDPQAKTLLEASKPIPAILRHAPQYDLVVMGTHGEDSLTDRLLGTTAERVVAQSDTPVAVVGQDSQIAPLAHAVVGYSPTEAAERAAVLAQRLSQMTGGRLSLAYAGSDQALEQLEQQAAALVLRQEGRADVKVIGTTQAAGPALLELAQEVKAQALFVGRSRSLGIFGSVPRWLIAHAKLPVFVQP